MDVLEQDRNCTNRRGTSNTGNLLIVGNKGNGKTVLAVDVVKAIQKQRKIRQGRVAIITGEALNKKKISDIIAKLYGGALIIEKAGKLSERTVAKLNKAMEKDTGEMLIVLEEQRKPLDRILSSNREFRKKFTSRLEVPIFVMMSWLHSVRRMHRRMDTGSTRWESWHCTVVSMHCREKIMQ